MLPLLAQAFGAYNLGQLIIVAIVVGAILYIFNAVVELPPKIKMIVNVVILAIVAIVAVKILLGFL
jgi:hypothetical protein